MPSNSKSRRRSFTNQGVNVNKIVSENVIKQQKEGKRVVDTGRLRRTSSLYDKHRDNFMCGLLHYDRFNLSMPVSNW